MKIKHTIILLLILSALILYNLKYYSNNYSIIEKYNHNRVAFQEIINDIDQGKYDSIEKIHSSCNKNLGYCTDILKMRNQIISDTIGITRIEKIYGEGKDYLLIFFIDNKYQFTTSVLEFNTKKINNGEEGWYLPFPFSNKYIYFGSSYIGLGSGWSIYSKLESAYD